MLKVKPLSTSQFTLLLALYFLLVINVPLTTRLVGILENTEAVPLGMVLSLPLFFGSLFYILFSCVTFRYVIKPISVALVLVSSLVSYAMYYYGTVFDMDMIRNIAETHSGEARSYLNSNVVVWWLATGLMPAALIVAIPLESKPFVRELLSKASTVLIAFLVIGGIAGLYYKDYASLGRNNSYLNKLIIPTQYLYSAGRYVKKTLAPPRAHQSLGKDARVADADGRQKPRLLVMVVGETARAKNFELNGYPRPTNEFTRGLGLVSFKQMQSCGTATAVSVPCMFSRDDRATYDPDLAKTQDNLLDVMTHAGINIRWLENDGGCKGVCKRVSTLEFDKSLKIPACDGEYCRDEVLLPNLEQELIALQGGDAVLVLHLVGSHGPTYYQRYPETFRKFSPDCPRSDIQNCTDREIVNSYDNTIHYDDYILSQVISLLERQPQWQSSLLYVSDHGESLGENGMYLHGMPYAFAPEEQTQIPMLLWMSPEFSATSGYNRGCIEQKADQESFSHDNLFDSVLGLMQVTTEQYRPELDVLSTCQKHPVVAQTLGSPAVQG